jgi:hypothetical protein
MNNEELSRLLYAELDIAKGRKKHGSSSGELLNVFKR